MSRAAVAYGTPLDPARALLAKHGALVDRCARRLAARTGHAVQADDLWSAGAMGLLEAARRFDGAQGAKFETFAEHRIRGAMLDEMRRMDHLPRRLRADADRVDRERSRLAQQLGRDATPEDLAASLGLALEDVAEVLQLLEPAVPVLDDHAAADEPPADVVLAARDLRRSVAGAIAALPERLQILLALYYDEGLTYREIAKAMNVSEPRVCQLHSDAMKRLRSALAEAG